MTKRSAAKQSFATAAKSAAARGRAIQSNIDRLEAGRKNPNPTRRCRRASAPTLRSFRAARDQAGVEAELKLAPKYQAPIIKARTNSRQRRAGDRRDSGIGRAVAVLYAREGADVAIAYLDEHDDAEKTKRAVEAEAAAASLSPATSPIQNFARRRCRRPSRPSAK